MMLRTVLKLSCLFVSVFIIAPTHAALPYTFANGQPADASQLNADLQALQTQINQLQAQLTAQQPTSASTGILGTWNYISVGLWMSAGSNTPSFGDSQESGTVTFNSNGTLLLNQNHNDYQLNVSNDQSPIGCSVPLTTCNITGATKSGITTNGASNPKTGSKSGTYSVSGSTVTINIDSPTTGFISADHAVIILPWTSGDPNASGIVVLVKQ